MRNPAILGSAALNIARPTGDTLDIMHNILAQLLDAQPLTQTQAQEAFNLVLTGKANEAQVGAMLALLQSRGVTLDELVGGAIEMRRYVTPVPLDPHLKGPVIDTCGTGGAPKTFNISTASAIVAASVEFKGQRLRVAKHGGRSRSGRGSAEVLEQLGVNIDASPAVQGKCLKEVGVCFSFAIHHHPAMRFAAGPRKSLGFPTIFNLLGPLTNPAGAPYQLLGVYDRDKAELVAGALARLGAERAWVVHGNDGMDEITTTDTTHVFVVTDGGVQHEEIDPQGFGIPRASMGALRANDLDGAAEVIRDVLEGVKGAPRDIVEINAAAALVVGGVCEGLGEAIPVVREAIDSGAAKRTLKELARVSQTRD